MRQDAASDSGCVQDSGALPINGRMRRWGFLIGAMLLLLGLRVYVLTHTEVIARDGITYVKMARVWETSPSQAIQGDDYHVGYSVAISALHTVLETCGLVSGPGGWDVSGQLVSLLAGMLAMLGIWAWTRKCFPGDDRVALLSVLLFGVTKKWSAMNVDVLSDSLSGCFMVWAFVLVLHAIQLHRKGSWWMVGAGVFAGVISGLGYLVRPEGLAVAVFGFVAFLSAGALKRAGRAKALLSAFGCLAASVIVGLPYMIAIGGVTKKKSIFDMLQSVIGKVDGKTQGMLATLAGGEGDWGSLVGQLLGEMVDCMHPILALLLVTWIVTVVLGRLFPVILSDARIALMPKRYPGICLVLVMLVYLPITWMLMKTAGYLSYRHMLFPVLLCIPLCGTGCMILSEIAYKMVFFFRLPRWFAELSWGLVPAGLVLGLGIHAMAPLHEGKGVYRDMGFELASLAESGDSVLSGSGWVSHYARQKNPGLQVVFYPQSMQQQQFEEVVRKKVPCWIVVVSRDRGHVAPFLRIGYTLKHSASDGKRTIMLLRHPGNRQGG